MYLESVRLQNLKCFDDLTLDFQSAGRTGDPQSNWNVILGDNGVGKTSLLRGIATCLMDASTAEQMLRPNGWIRDPAQRARLTARIVQEPGDLVQGAQPDPAQLTRTVQYAIVNAGEEITLDNGQKEFFSSTRIMEPNPAYRALFVGEFDNLFDDINFMKRNAFLGKINSGWFNRGYGAHRRITEKYNKTQISNIEEKNLTLFYENEGLMILETWKQLSPFAKMEKSGFFAYTLPIVDALKEILISTLPGIEEIFLEGDIICQWQGRKVALAGLSDGYRSMFALAMDISLWLILSYQLSATRFSQAHPGLNLGSGIVLIDEVDAHLHPRWQREVGFLLTRAFPNIQFIVTSHSPFVAMAAGKGSLTVLENQGDAVRHSQDVPYVRGWAADQVLTQLFGLYSLRDPETTAKLERYETLSFARRAGRLAPEEAAEIASLEAYLNERLKGDADSPRERHMDQDIALFQEELKKRQKDHA